MSLATTTIGELNPGAPLQGTDLFVVERIGGANFKMTSTEVATFIGGGSPLTTKGDLFTFDTGDQRLAVGPDGQVLIADSAEPTGIKWGPVPSPPTAVQFVNQKGIQDRFIDNTETDTFLSFDFDEIGTVESDVNIQQPIAQTATLSNFKIRVTQNDLDVALVLTLRLNGANTTIVITVPSSTLGIFTSANSLAVVADDLLNWQFSIAGASGGSVSGVQVAWATEIVAVS